MADEETRYANIRQILGHLIGRELMDITQHDEDEFRESGECFVCLMFKGGGTVTFLIDKSFSYGAVEDDEPLNTSQAVDLLIETAAIRERTLINAFEEREKTMALFDPKALEAAARRQLELETIPAGHTSAMVVAVTTDGIKGAVMSKFGEHWTLAGTVEYDRIKPNIEAGIMVQATW